MNLLLVLTNLVSIDLEKFETDLKHKISSIKIPTLIVWGEDDEVIIYKLIIELIISMILNYKKMLHVSGAKLLADNIENSQLKIIENCNHVLQLDQPKKTAKFIVDFVKANSY